MKLNGTLKVAYLVFLPAQKKFPAKGGSNRISGIYELNKKGHTVFNNIAGTIMSFVDMDLKQKYCKH